jgi:L-alanine-DL-glutamate epimerase-like enolase superfamily enzyme
VDGKPTSPATEAWIPAELHEFAAAMEEQTGELFERMVAGEAEEALRELAVGASSNGHG